MIHYSTTFRHANVAHFLPHTRVTQLTINLLNQQKEHFDHLLIAGISDVSVSL